MRTSRAKDVLSSFCQSQETEKLSTPGGGAGSRPDGSSPAAPGVRNQ
ncbi:hypothetical protein AB5J55_37435 [Streptomyces sp. R11]|uniref:Uncharacterized protein n=1 Tax=Streptomyces sp. R11 TaxID=3238625 RepID=A0AB39N9H4_9ACTN